MALQGTLDTFELPDVLRLLASTKKTGRLFLEGDRGQGSVWLAAGQVSGVDATGTPGGEAAEALFDLLRARAGSFAFEPGVEPADAGAPQDVEPLLAVAEERLAEWRDIEAVVPSLHAWVSLVPELPGPDVTVDAATWRLVTTIGSGVTVADIARDLGVGEVPACRVVRDLVVLGLGAITDAPAPAATWQPPVAEVQVPSGTNGYAANGYETNGHGTNGYEANGYETNGHGTNGYEANGYEANGFEANGQDTYDTNGFEANGQESGYANGHDLTEPAVEGNGAYAGGGFEGLEPASWATEAPADRAPIFAVAEPATFHHDLEVPAEPVAEAAVTPEPVYEDDADEVARQLAMLSPRAAQAVAAAAAADTEDERIAHLDSIDETDEPINRGLLLKFLSSVKS